MAEGKEPVEEFELEEAQAQEAEGGSPDGDLLADFDDLLGGDAQPGEAKKSATDDGDMDLTELESFLDDFNRSLDGSEDDGTPEPPESTEAGSSAGADDELEGWGEELWEEEGPAPADEAAVLDDALEPQEDEAAVPDDAEPQEEEAAVPDDALEPQEDEAAVLDDVLEPQEDEAAILEEPLDTPEMSGSAADVASGEIEALDAFEDELLPGEAGELEPKTSLEADELDLSFADEQEPGVESPEAASGTGRGDDEFQELDLDAFDDTAAEAGAEVVSPEAPDEEPAEPPEEMEPVGESVQPPPASAGESRTEAPPPAAVSRPSPAPVPDSGRKFAIAAALAGIGLLVAGAAGFLAYDLSGRVDALNRTVASLQQNSQTTAADGALAQRVDALSREATKLGARLSELAIIIEGPMSHLRESNERDIRNVVARMEQVEKSLQELRASASRPRPSPAAAAPQSAGEKPWVVNVVSLSNRSTALEEKTRLEKLGIDTALQQVNVDGRSWYRLRVTGFASKAQAEDYAARVRRKAADLGGAWVTRD